MNIEALKKRDNLTVSKFKRGLIKELKKVKGNYSIFYADIDVIIKLIKET